MSPDLIHALVSTLELKDFSTAAHTWRVILYTRAMAESAGIDAPLITRLSHAAALHDIGKIDIPERVLQKPGPLTPEEFEVMKRHAVLGHERLVRMEESDPILLEVVRHHHERWDGTGYPDRLAADAIPIAARYFAVIDSFDAMTSSRVYRPTIAPDAVDRALGELTTHRGTHYCPEAIDLFLRLHQSGQLSWILHHFNDSTPGLSAQTAIIGQSQLPRRIPASA